VITPYIEANWLHNNRGYGVRMNGVLAETNSGRNIGQVKVGVEGEINKSLSVKAEAFHNQGSSKYRETGGSLAIRYRY